MTTEQNNSLRIVVIPVAIAAALMAGSIMFDSFKDMKVQIETTPKTKVKALEIDIHASALMEVQFR